MARRRLYSCRCRTDKRYCPSRYQGTQSTTCGALADQFILLDPQALSLDINNMQSHGLSRLLGLPLEIREIIYEKMLTTHDEIYLGIVGLEQHRPHHWHMAITLPECPGLIHPRFMHGMSSHHEFRRTPTCAHRCASSPYYLCLNLLLACKQLHSECSHILYNRNSFSIDLDVPDTKDMAKLYGIPLLRLGDITPLNPAYHTSLRNVDFRLFNPGMLSYPV
jgi:hypothetical protein